MKYILFVCFLICVAEFIGQFSVQAASFDEFVENKTDSTPHEKVTPFTPEQKELIAQFKIENNDLLTNDYTRSDDYAIGFLRVNKWNLKTANRKFKQYLAWRVENKVDEIGESDLPPEMARLFPFRVSSARNADGCVIMEYDWGGWDVASFISSQEFLRDGIKAFQRHGIAMWEKSRHAMQKNPTNCTQAIYLWDIKGFTMKNVAETNALAIYIQIVLNYETYYHNVGRDSIFFNATPDFVTFMNIVKPSLGGATLDVFRFYREDEADKAKEDILNNCKIDPKDLPPRYYGVKGL